GFAGGTIRYHPASAPTLMWVSNRFIAACLLFAASASTFSVGTKPSVRSSTDARRNVTLTHGSHPTARRAVARIRPLGREDFLAFGASAWGTRFGAGVTAHGIAVFPAAGRAAEAVPAREGFDEHGAVAAGAL